jgi:hypothetical protein
MVAETHLQSQSFSSVSGLVHKLESVFELSAEVINGIGGLILVGVTLISIIHTLQYFLNELIGSDTQKFWIGKGFCTLDNIRLKLGTGITFALELLVSADVIDTLTKPAHLYRFETLFKIGFVVAIRTALSYFLGKEIEELEHKVKLHKGGKHD